MKSFQSNWISATIVAVFAFYNRLEQEKQRPEFKQKICTVYLVQFLSCYFDFYFSEIKFSETKTETFFRDQIFRNWNFFPSPNSPKPRKVLERNVFVSNSEIKAEIEQPDHEVKVKWTFLFRFCESRQWHIPTEGRSHWWRVPRLLCQLLLQKKRVVNKITDMTWHIVRRCRL